MKKSLWKVLCGVLVVVFMVSCASTLIACKGKETKDTLVVGYNNFEEKFSPFFATNAYDVDVANMTQVSLLSSDRGGNIVYNGINGEKIMYNGTEYTYYGLSDLKVTQNEDGTVDYALKVRKDVKFSDGTALTIKDVIFNMYVFSDIDYDGSTTFFSLPIEGMAEWRANLNTTVLNEVNGAAEAIVKAIDAETFEYAYDADSTAYTKEQFDSLTAKLNPLWKVLGQEIIEYCVAGYKAEYGADYANNDVALGMGLWGFGGMNEDGTFTDSNEKTYTMVGEDVPTADDYADCLKAAYEGNILEAWDVEKAGTDKAAAAYDAWIAEEGSAKMNGESVKSISGITFDETAYTVNVKTTKYSATTVYQLALSIAPMAYYGDAAKWDPANGSYGFTRGDLNGVRSKTTKPMGAGPYKYVDYKDGIVSFEANENYWEGEPKIKYVRFKEMADADKLPAIVKGEIDVANPSFSDSVVDQIKKANGNDKLAIDASLKISTDLVDNNGYGYFGMNADRVLVGTNKASDASKNLRKGFATLVASYREYTVRSYYHERASVIEYPISNCSWAAPQPADAGYAIAYSKDVDGNAIYTADMTEEQRWAAAKDAFIGFLKAAGYTWDDATSKFTAAPEGAALAYEVIVGGDGKGDHPTYAMLLKVKEVLASVGITFQVTDDSNNLFKRVQAGSVDMFALAWGGSADPDMYQIYHSDSLTGSNHYRIADAELDALIMAARESADTNYRKAEYKKCLDIILDWGVEVPVYQRKNGYVFNGTAVDVTTITPDTTPFWTYMSEIHKLELAK